MTADIVCAIMDDLDLNQRTVLRKLNYKHRIMTMWVKIRTLVDTMLNLVIDGKDLLLHIHANESNFDCFKDDFGDGGKWLTRSCDYIKYLTLYNAGRLIAIQSLGPVAVEGDNCGSEEQEKTTEQLLVSTPVRKR